MSYDTGSSPNYDMVLGMAFRTFPSKYSFDLCLNRVIVRNVYVLMDYGDFVLGTTQKDDPYIQFLSLTDPAEGAFMQY